MPVYKYRGVTEKGQVISNRIEMDSKQKVIDKLKENNIMPIDITQVGISLRKNKQRKNMAQAKEIFKEVEVYFYVTVDGDLYKVELKGVSFVGKIDEMNPAIKIAKITNTTSTITVEVAIARNEGGKLEYYIKSEDEEEAIKTVCDNTKLDIPNGMIEMEIDNMVRELENRLSYQGLNLNQYLQIMGRTEEDIRKDYKEQAEKSVKSRLVLEAIVKAEKIEVTPEEVTEKIKEMAKQYGRKEEELLENVQLKEYIEENLKTEKAIDFIVQNAKRKRAVRTDDVLY